MPSGNPGMPRFTRLSITTACRIAAELEASDEPIAPVRARCPSCGGAKSRRADQCSLCAGRGRPRADTHRPAFRFARPPVEEVCLQCGERRTVAAPQLHRPACTRCGGWVGVDA